MHLKRVGEHHKIAHQQHIVLQIQREHIMRVKPQTHIRSHIRVATARGQNQQTQPQHITPLLRRRQTLVPKQDTVSQDGWSVKRRPLFRLDSIGHIPRAKTLPRNGAKML